MPASKSTAQVFIIGRTDTVPMYWSGKLGRQFGAPQGAWGPDPNEATRFSSEHDAQERIDRMGVMAPVCEILPYAPGQPEAAAVDLKRPRYRLKEAAFINDQLLEAGVEITYLGVPGPHMEPINEAATEKFGECYPLGSDPLQELEQALALAPLETLND